MSSQRKRASKANIQNSPEPLPALPPPIAVVPNPSEPPPSPALSMVGVPNPSEPPPPPSLSMVDVPHLPETPTTPPPSMAVVPNPPEPPTTPSPSMADNPSPLEPSPNSSPPPTANDSKLPKPPPKASPKKREGVRLPTGSSKKGKENKSLTLTVYTFHPDLSIEGYLYTKDDKSDGFCNAYKKFVDKLIPYQPLTDAGFTGYKPRRRVPGCNDILTDPRGYWRYVILRYIPISTPETRQEGLNVLSEFLRDPAHTQYPPSDIITRHGSADETYFSLDEFFQDAVIQDIIETEIATDEMVPEFFRRYPEMAAKLWSVGPYPAWARDKLGFGVEAFQP